MNELPPRSLHNRSKTYIRIVNLTERCVDIIWINFTGEYVRYQRLDSKSFLDINTYETHPWIAIDSETRNRLHLDKRFVYMPESWSDYLSKRCPYLSADMLPQNITPRILVPVTNPLHTLRYRTLLAVRSFVKNENDLKLLELPKELIDDLRLLIIERNRFPLQLV